MNIFTQIFGNEPTEHYIEALGQTIKLRKLTLKEQWEFQQRMIKSVNGKNVEIDYEEATKIKYEKIAKAMVEPSMTAEELMSLPADAETAVDEIYALVDPKGAAAVEEVMQAELEEGKRPQ
jgi:hypothetical protein